MSRPSPRPSSPVGSPATSRSTNLRSSTERHAVSRTNSVARHSLIRPFDKARNVHGISVSRALAKPRMRFPRAGDSRRARAICAATPLPCCSCGSPACAWARRTEMSKAAAALACAALAAAFSSSNTRRRSTSPASESPVTAARDAAEESRRIQPWTVSTDTAAGAWEPPSVSVNGKGDAASLCFPDARAGVERHPGASVVPDGPGRPPDVSSRPPVTAPMRA